MTKLRKQKVRFFGVFIVLSGTFLLLSANEIHYRVVDDFSTNANWTSEVINHQNPGPLFHTGIWSDPIQGPTLKVRNNMAYFHFPALESWILEGFEYAYHLKSKDQKGLQEFEGNNYLSFNIVNKSSETIWMKFRVLDEISYTYSNRNGTTKEEALAELITEPDSFRVKPNTAPQHLRLLLKKPVLKDESMRNIKYKNQVKFFAFETRRTVSSSKSKPTLDCTLIIDHLQIEDEKGGN